MEYKSARDLWDAALGELQVQVSKSNYKTWLDKTAGISFEEGRFVIAVPNTFVAEYLEKNQQSLIEKTLIGITRSKIEVSFRVDGVANASSTGKKQPGPALNTNYTFDSFVVGANNQLAYAAAIEIIDKPGKSFNPLVICGTSGFGKTHLLQAIGHKASENLKVIYASGEQYTNEFVSALKERRTEEFRTRYRSAEMLLIDDVSFITGKEQTEESLYHTIDELENSSRQVVLTCDGSLLQ